MTTLAYAQLFGATAPLGVASPFSIVFSDGPNLVGTNGVLLHVVGRDGEEAYRFLDLIDVNLEVARGRIGERPCT